MLAAVVFWRLVSILMLLLDVQLALGHHVTMELPVKAVLLLMVTEPLDLASVRALWLFRSSFILEGVCGSHLLPMLVDHARYRQVKTFDQSWITGVMSFCLAMHLSINAIALRRPDPGRHHKLALKLVMRSLAPDYGHSLTTTSTLIAFQSLSSLGCFSFLSLDLYF